MNAPVRSAPADRVASASSPRAKDAEAARARVVEALLRAREVSSPKTLADRVTAFRVVAGHPAARVAAFVAVLALLTLLGARVGARGPVAASSAASASAPDVPSTIPVVAVDSLPDAPPPVASASGAAEPDGGAPSSPGTLPDGRVVLNLATEDDLARLPHIGPSRARAILALRQKLGKFHTVSELLRVKGLGRKTLAKLAPRLLVDPPKEPASGT